MSGLPADRHHGVGFFVSPQLRLHVTNFISHSPRIAEITLHTLPHPVTILNVYAPSMVDDPEKDRDREADFWTMLEEIVASQSNLDHLIVLGHLNASLIKKEFILVPQWWANVSQSLMQTGIMQSIY